MTTARWICLGDVGYDDYEDEAAPRPGGCALNVARSAVLAGAQGVACAGVLGADGDPLREQLDAWGVDTSLLGAASGATPRQRIRLRGGERTLCGHTPGVLSTYALPARVRDALTRSNLVHVPLFSATRGWAASAWETAPRVAVDLMDLEELEPGEARAAVGRSAIAFAGLDPSAQAAEVAALLQVAAATGALVVVTLGAEGAVARHGAGPEVRVPAAPLPGALVDTTGCGDAFAGTFLAAHLGGAPLIEALTQAARRAARVATHRGAVQVPGRVS